MKDKINFAWLVIGLTSGIIIYNRFAYIRKYQDIIIPVVITLFFAAFVTLLADWLKRKHELFRVQYKAYEDANLYLNDFDKEFRIQRLILTAIPQQYMISSEISEKGWTHYVKMQDSISKLISSIVTLKGLFKSQAVKKCIAQFEQKLDELDKISSDFIAVRQTESNKAITDPDAYIKIIIQKNNEIEQSFKYVKDVFLMLEMAIFKEMKIR